MSEISSEEKFWIEVTANGPANELFVWRAELDWTWSRCSEICTDCIGSISDESIDDYEGDSHSVSTHTWWSYEGNISNNEYVGTDEYTPYVISFRQDLYDGGNLFGYPLGAANPFAELKGNARGASEAIDWDADI